MITTTNTIYFEIDNISPLCQMKIYKQKKFQLKKTKQKKTKTRGPIHVEVSILTCIHDLHFTFIF